MAHPTSVSRTSTKLVPRAPAPAPGAQMPILCTGLSCHKAWYAVISIKCWITAIFLYIDVIILINVMLVFDNLFFAPDPDVFTCCFSDQLGLWERECDVI